MTSSLATTIDPSRSIGCGVEMTQVPPSTEETETTLKRSGAKSAVKQLLDEARVGDGNNLIGCQGRALPRASSIGAGEAHANVSVRPRLGQDVGDRDHRCVGLVDAWHAD